jgi:hypothetical protein
VTDPAVVLLVRDGWRKRLLMGSLEGSWVFFKLLLLFDFDVRFGVVLPTDGDAEEGSVVQGVISVSTVGSSASSCVMTSKASSISMMMV